jgi:iron complex outermembrane receptor protein
VRIGVKKRGVWLACAVCTVATASKAQEALPEVVITAPGGDPFQTTTDVSSGEIERGASSSLADLMAGKPGLAASTFAPGASRPVIRGLGEYRVRVQENGVGVHDASDFSPDHGVPIDPVATERIEVIRGPATLRYGSQAIGGVVSATNNRIPETLPPDGFTARFKGATTSVDKGYDSGVVLDAGRDRFAVHLDAFTRKADDYRIPGGRQLNSRLRTNGQAAGGSYIFDGGYAGVSIAHVSSLYHIPGLEDAQQNTRIDMRQTKIASKGELRAPFSGIDAIRYTLGASDYIHKELGIGIDGVDRDHNTIKNKEEEGRIEFDHAPVTTALGPLTGNFGTQFAHRQLGTSGDLGGLLAPTNTWSFAAYAFQQLALTETLKLQAAGRYEAVSVSGLAPTFPANFLPPPATFTQTDAKRNFAPKSASFGLLKFLPWDMTGTLTAQYVQRAPAAPELYSRGSDDASGTFVIGNPNLKTETAQSVELGLKRTSGGVRFEANAYYTRYQDFIFKALTGNRCFDEFATCGATGPLLQVVYGQRDAAFRGGEFSTQIDLTPPGDGVFGVEAQFDAVRATFADGSNVPRIAPLRVGGGLWWRNAEWKARVNLLHAFGQNDLGQNETPTPGYNLLRADLSRTQPLSRTESGFREITYGIAGDNLLDENIRNHVSFKKDEVLQPGRNVRLFASLRF